MKRDPIKKVRKTDISVGFFGGGQLARMLALAAHPLSLNPKVLASSLKDPACSVTSQNFIGDTNSKADIQNFLKNLNLATFESEFINVSLIDEASKNLDCYIFPSPSLMKQLQNRLSQKKTLDRFRIETSPWHEISESKDLDLAWTKLGGKFVLKSSFGGYDGNGTFLALKQSDLGKLSEKVSNDSQKFLAEKFISFKRELACIYVRGRNGDFTHFPLVETKQSNNRCDWVMGPMKHPDFKKVSTKIQKMMKDLDYVGVLGVEFFDTGKKLLVNELAPRVHNSGHYTQNAFDHSQFEMHLLAGLGEKLPKPQALSKAFVMTNLIGESNKAFEFPEGLTGKLHWYNKLENRSGRKMGHVNYIGKSAKTLLTKALNERKKISK